MEQLAQPTVDDLCQWLEPVAPLALSESWDNTGLLLGDRRESVSRVMTCLTLTPESVAEAVSQNAQFVVAHHPLPFKPLAQITTDTHYGGLLWQLARAGVSIYSPHTAWDSAAGGINAQLANLLELSECRPIVPSQQAGLAGLGAGRLGRLPSPLSLRQVSERLTERLADCRPRGVDCGQKIERVAIACGSGGSLLSDVIGAGGCDLFLTGEGTFHTCLEAQAAGISLLMIGHFASERFAMEGLAETLQQAWPALRVWASRSERDPVRNL